MFDRIRFWLARRLAPSLFRSHAAREQQLDNEVNQRVALTLSKMDPFEPLLKEFQGIFSEEYEHPEDKLDDRGQLLLKTWAWQMRDHPSFSYLISWILNTQGNETLKRAPVTPERILYGRAQIAGMILFRREVQRLAQLYDDELAKRKGEDFDSALSVE